MEGAFTGAQIDGLMHGVLADARQAGALQPFLHRGHIFVPDGLGRCEGSSSDWETAPGPTASASARAACRRKRTFRGSLWGFPQCYKHVGEIGPQIAVLGVLAVSQPLLGPRPYPKYAAILDHHLRHLSRGTSLPSRDRRAELRPSRRTSGRPTRRATPLRNATALRDESALLGARLAGPLPAKTGPASRISQVSTSVVTERNPFGLPDKG